MSLIDIDSILSSIKGKFRNHNVKCVSLDTNSNFRYHQKDTKNDNRKMWSPPNAYTASKDIVPALNISSHTLTDLLIYITFLQTPLKIRLICKWMKNVSVSGLLPKWQKVFTMPPRFIKLDRKYDIGQICFLDSGDMHSFTRWKGFNHTRDTHTHTLPHGCGTPIVCITHWLTSCHTCILWYSHLIWHSESVHIWCRNIYICGTHQIQTYSHISTHIISPLVAFQSVFQKINRIQLLILGKKNKIRKMILC